MLTVKPEFYLLWTAHITQTYNKALLSPLTWSWTFQQTQFNSENGLRLFFSEIQAPHELVYIDRPNKICLEQIAKRRIEQPERAATDTEEMFELVSKYFVAPTSDEGFNTTVISVNA